MNAFVQKSARMPMEWFIGLVCAVSRLGFLLTLLGGIGPPHNISNTFTTRIGEVEQLKCVRCNKLFPTTRARAAHESACRFCRWCDKMFRSQANRARHELVCSDRPAEAAVLD